MGAAATLPGPAAEHASVSDGRRRRQAAVALAGSAKALPYYGATEYSASRRLAHTYRTRLRAADHRFGRSATAPTTVTSYPPPFFLLIFSRTSRNVAHAKRRHVVRR
eukprot:1545747-Prymnesium_polylepis.1